MLWALINCGDLPFNYFYDDILSSANLLAELIYVRETVGGIPNITLNKEKLDLGLLIIDVCAGYRIVASFVCKPIFVFNLISLVCGMYLLRVRAH